jgi:hypothetical protein
VIARMGIMGSLTMAVERLVAPARPRLGAAHLRLGWLPGGCSGHVRVAGSRSIVQAAHLVRVGVIAVAG